MTTPGGMPWQNLPPVSAVYLKEVNAQNCSAVSRCSSPGHVCPLLSLMFYSCRYSLLMIKEPKNKVPTILKMLYPAAWLDEIAVGDPQQRTNRQVQAEVSCLIIFHEKQTYTPQHHRHFSAASHSAPNSASLDTSLSLPQVSLIMFLPNGSAKFRRRFPRSSSFAEMRIGWWMCSIRKTSRHVCLRRNFCSGKTQAMGFTLNALQMFVTF